MKKSLLLLSMLFLGLTLMAQKQYTITVTDAASGKPVANPSARIKPGKKGVAGNAEGLIQIQANADDLVEITSVGYQPTTVKLGFSGNVTVTLQSSSVDMGDVVMVGTRGAARAKLETAVPVDVIHVNSTGMPTARMDMTSILNMAAPSFNYNRQTGADGADHIDLGTLRGLGPDQTLVLINGKRRHQTAFVALFGTRGRGNSGADLNAFPQSAVDRIEILRDGASAQYGSDAMAGVMNIMLRRDVNRWSITTGWAGYYDDKFNAYRTRKTNQYVYSQPIDGGTVSLTANNGLPIGKNGGFINFSLEYLKQAKTFRQVADTNVSTSYQALPLNVSRRAFGDASLDKFGAMINMEIPSRNKRTIVYAFGGYNYKQSDAYAYSRNLSARPDRFPIDANGDVVFDPSIMKVADDGEIYYNPIIQSVIQDVSMSAGVKGTLKRNWNWDISNTFGRNDFHYYGKRTFNASSIITNNTRRQTNFDDGGFNFLQNTLNLDISKSFPHIAQGLNIGFGTEFRYEYYTIYKGEEASYAGYPNSFGQAPGAQGFPGFSPADEIKKSRSNLGAYIDAELNITKSWLANAAIRFENYSDFGSLATYKFATRYLINKEFNLRGSVSTGFRAPSLQQINFSNTLTSFSAGQLVQSRIARNGDEITQAAGIPKLKEETSTNASVGFAYKPIKGLTITVDGYWVQVKDRIVLSGLFNKDDNTLPLAFTSKLEEIGVQTAQFFANSVNTTNKGVDVVIDYSTRWRNERFKFMIAANFQQMEVDKVNVPVSLDDSYRHRKTFFSDREEAFLLASAPRSKGTMNIEYGIRRWTFGARLNYFGEQRSLGFGWTGLASAAGTGGPGDPEISGSFTGIDPYVDIDGFSDGVNVLPEVFRYDPKVTVDFYTSFKMSKRTSIFIGADNVFNVHPNFAAVTLARYQAFDNEAGGAWEPVQMGYNGRRLFARLAIQF